MLFFYRVLINFILFISPIVLVYRLFKNKEHPKRFLEKYSISSEKRKFGKLIWIHGSSVGEILSVIPLIQKLEKKKNISQILLTSSTLSSSKVIKKFKLKKTIHQFFPIDSTIIINNFLNFWKPYLAIFIESEIWPNTILNLENRKIKLILLNARITKKSFYKWKKINSFSKNIFEKFKVCLVQNKETKTYLKKLGAKKIKNIGNLKFSDSNINKKNYINKKKYNFLKTKKIFFVGISTHNPEELFCAQIHKNLKVKYKNGLTIIIPRHVHRVEQIKNEIEKEGFNVHLHSSKNKIDNKTDIYLVDTYGETNSFLKNCKIVFLGGSLIKHGGQNPLEAARLGCKVIHGPYIDNFTEVYELLNKIKISSKIKNINQAKNEILKNLNKKYNSKKNIKRLNFIGNKALNLNEKEINKYIK